MNEVKYDNAIYEEVHPADNNEITVKTNDCYGKVEKPARAWINQPRALKKKTSYKKIVVVTILAFATLVLLLGAVAASTGYEIKKINAEIASSDEAAAQQQNADFNSKVNSSIELLQHQLTHFTSKLNSSIESLQQQLIEELNTRFQQLNERIIQIQASSNETYSYLDSRISQVQTSSQVAVHDVNISITMLQQQSFTLNTLILNMAQQLGAAIFYCGNTSGWRRVGYLDMTDPSQSCPSGLDLKTYSPGLRSCGRSDSSRGCWSTFYNTGDSQYSRVCGRVRGYQYGYTGAFRNFHSQGFDGYYVDGVSLTHGQIGSRSHIWTFAAGLTQSSTAIYPGNTCPCTSSSGTPPQAFVGNDYFCESGYHGNGVPFSLFFPNDPLWDGQNCVDSCCQFNNPPYFTKNLSAPTTDDIELRICDRHDISYGDSPIDQLELYVQ